MAQASSRRSATVVASRNYAKRRRKVKRTIPSRTIIATTSLLSQKYGLLPCFCHHDPLRMIKRCSLSALSKSSNAFWHRSTKSAGKKQQRNNSTASETRSLNSARSNKLTVFRKSIAQRLKGNQKRKMPTITARSVIRKRPNSNSHEEKTSMDHLSNTTQISLEQPLSTQDDGQHSLYESDRLVSPDGSYESDDNHTLETTISSINPEQQNINAMKNISRTDQETSQSTINDLSSWRRIKQNNSRTNRSKTTRNTLSRSTINSPKTRKKQKRTQKRKITVSKKNLIPKSKRRYAKASLSRTRRTTSRKRKTYGRSPFPNPNMFHTMPPMQDSDEITEDNVHANHLCCKPITSVKGLSGSDQKKLIEHDHLTLISLLPIYLGSQGDFQHKVRERTDISHEGAAELDRLMNEWSSTRLFIGANSHCKTLTQRI